MRLPAAFRHWPRRAATGLGVGVSVLVLTATQASAAGPGHYTINGSHGATFSMLNSNNLAPGAVDDALYYLSTTGSGIHRLPFALDLYNQTYVNIAISSNGNIQPGQTPTGNATDAYSNVCLGSPTATTFHGKPVVLPYWDDLDFNYTGPLGQGIFLRTQGSAPHRKFTVSWQGREHDTGNPVEAQVIFTEGSQTVTYVYGVAGGASATIGIQSKQNLSFSQFTCNSGLSNSVTQGLKLTLTHSG